MNQCENSLRRLQTDYIDLYWLHNWDVHTPIDETMAALEYLIRSGKVRYIGISDTPAWKVVEANMLARFRGWSQFIGLQIEYSLLQRSVEAELVPMAQELGLGITPWSPLKGGVLSVKYTRATDGQHKPDRAAMVTSSLNESTYTLIDVLEKIAKARESTVARVALAWVRMRLGVTSTILGARRVSQLKDNLKSMEITLTADEIAHLDGLTKPALPFPQNMQSYLPAIHNGGTTINGVAGGPSMIIKPGETPY